MERKVIIKEFFGPGQDLHEDQLGWQEEEKREARSLVSKDVFDTEVVKIGWNLTFYYVDNDTLYGIHAEELPTPVKLLPRDRDEPYIHWQFKSDTHEDCPVIASFEDPREIWDNLKIDGKSLEEVLERSFIVALR